MYKAYKTFAPQLLKSQCSVNSQLPKYFSTIVTLQPTDCGWDICIGFHYCQHHVAHCQDLSKLLQALSSLFSSLSSATSHMPFNFISAKFVEPENNISWKTLAAEAAHQTIKITSQSLIK